MTRSELIIAIRERYHRFKGETAIDATCIYLGRIEERLLIHHPEARATMIYQVEPRDLTTANKRATWEGLEIFIVDADNHLAVGTRTSRHANEGRSYQEHGAQSESHDQGPTKVKAAFVRDVVSGKCFTASHPVHQEIRAVYQAEARKK